MWLVVWCGELKINRLLLSSFFQFLRHVCHAPLSAWVSLDGVIEEYLPSNYTRPDKMDYLCPSPPPPDLGYSKATNSILILLGAALFLLGRYSKPTPFTRIPTTRSGKWTLAGWLGSAPGISEALAQALLKSRPTGQSELEFVISIAQECANSQAGRDKLVTMLRKGNALEGVAADMWYGVGQLATAKAARWCRRVHACWSRKVRASEACV